MTTYLCICLASSTFRLYITCRHSSWGTRNRGISWWGIPREEIKRGKRGIDRSKKRAFYWEKSRKLKTKLPILTSETNQCLKIQQKIYQKYILNIWYFFGGNLCTFCALFVIIGCYLRVKRFLELSSIPREEFHFFPRSSRGIKNRGKYDM